MGDRVGSGERALLRVWAAQLDGDSRIPISSHRRSWPLRRLRPNPHPFFKPLNLAGFDLNPPLSFGAALEIINGDRLTTDDELSSIRPRKPVVEARDRYAEPSCCFPRW